MKYIKLFFDWIEATSTLTDDEKGRLVDALVLYAREGVEPQLTGNERFVFPVFRLQMDRDLESYARSREDNARSCKSRSREDNARSREDNARSCEDKDQDQDKDEDKEKDKDEEQEEDHVLKKIDNNWRTSARARGGAAQLLVEHCLSGNLPCGGMKNLFDEIEGAMEVGLPPEEILACCHRAGERSLGYELYAAMKERGLSAR